MTTLTITTEVCYLKRQIIERPANTLIQGRLRSALRSMLASNHGHVKTVFDAFYLGISACSSFKALS